MVHIYYLEARESERMETKNRDLFYTMTWIMQTIEENRAHCMPKCIIQNDCERVNEIERIDETKARLQNTKCANRLRFNILQCF